MSECEYAFEHNEGFCDHCQLDVDQYGNTEADFLNCCFPDCGCDGNRLCMAPSGGNNCSVALNYEKGTFK